MEIQKRLRSLRLLPQDKKMERFQKIRKMMKTKIEKMPLRSKMEVEHRSTQKQRGPWRLHKFTTTKTPKKMENIPRLAKLLVKTANRQKMMLL